jgi:hypothetical protein
MRVDLLELPLSDRNGLAVGPEGDGARRGGALIDREDVFHRCTPKWSPHHGGTLEHDPEKWKPVFRQDHAPRRKTRAQSLQLKRLRFSRNGRMPALLDRVV